MPQNRISFRFFKTGSAAHFSLGCIGLMWIIPFLIPYHRYPIPSFYDELTAALLGIAALVLFVQKYYWGKIEFPRIAIMLLALMGLILLQCLLLGEITYPQRNIVAALYLLWAILLMMLARVLCITLGMGKIVPVLSWFLFIGGILSTLAGILQLYGIHYLFDILIVMPKLRPALYGNLGQPNLFSTYICLSLVSLTHLYAAGKLPKILAIISATLFLFVLNMAASRMSPLYLIAITLSALLFYWWNRSSASRSLLIVAALLLPGLILINFITHMLFSNFPTEAINIYNKTAYIKVHESVRITLWKEAWVMFLQNPFLGIGFGEFAWHHYLLLKTPLPEISGVYAHAHNLLLHLLAELGLFAPLIVLFFSLLWVISFLKQKLSITHWWLLTLLFVLGLHSMVEYPLWYSFFLGMAAILLGLGETKSKKLNTTHASRFIAVGVIAIGLGITYNLGTNYRILEQIIFNQDSEKVKNISAQEGLKILEKVYAESLFSPYAEYAYAKIIILNRTHLGTKLALNERVLHLVPGPELLLQQAILLALKGDIKNAENLLNRIDRNYPLFIVQKNAKLKEVSQKQGKEVTTLYSYAMQLLCNAPS